MIAKDLEPGSLFIYRHIFKGEYLTLKTGVIRANLLDATLSRIYHYDRDVEEFFASKHIKRVLT
jgi:hypothetical protein